MSARRPSRVSGPPLAIVAVLLALGLLGLFASTASALTYEVDGTGDTSGGACTGAAGDCTLRSAIELSNGSVGTLDLVGFVGSIFNGQLPQSRIPLGSALPAITDSVILNGSSSCVGSTGQTGPCVEVAAPSGASVLTVNNTDNLSINGLSLTGGQTGINVINSSQAATITGNWIGVKLDGTAGGNSGAGVFIDPDSNGALIGGGTAGARNVISYNGTGVDVEGADQAVIRGDFFGVKPEGTNAAANGKNIEITDSTAGGGFKAEENEVGAQLPAGAPTADCDEGCNVIGGSAIGIDLNGDGAGQNEAPASGPTLIHSNYIGLNFGGLAVVANQTIPTSFGIDVGAAKNVVIGGPSVSGGARNANRIAGGEYGIYDEKGQHLKVELNAIGINALGQAVTAPSAVGIFVYSQGVTEPATIQSNGIRMDGGVGIEQRFAGSKIVGNSINGTEFGILTEASGGLGSLIEENGIEGAEENAILIEDDGNRVWGNFVTKSGGAGIRVQTPFDEGKLPSTENVIGGPFAHENTISESGGPAIEISNLEESDNEVDANNGIGNAGSFIDLVSRNPGPEPNGPNHGIKPPTLSAATTTSMNGSALPGAKVIVFRKATASPGEIKSFIGEAVADGGGAWNLSYEDENEQAVTLPAGTNVAALQTSTTGGSSELALTTAQAPKEPEEKGTGGGGGGGGSTNPTDIAPPQTKITKGPKAKTSSTKAKFKFSSTEAGSTFQCKLDRKPFKSCRSPKKYSGLKPGKHVFKVRAIDAAGNTDSSPAVKKFKVLG